MPEQPSALQRPVKASDLWLLLGAVLLLALAARLVSVLLLSFAAVLVGLLLLQLSEPLRRRFGLRQPVALLLVVLSVTLLLVGGAWLVGAGITEQLQALRETLPRALEALRQWLASSAPGRWVLAAWAAADLRPGNLEELAGVATGTFNATIGAIGSLVLVIVMGIYLAADPATYRGGLVHLVPPRHRPLAERALASSGRDLGRWLVGQGVSMLAVGALTAAGLLLIGMPLAATLALIAGILEFVPYFGPLVSGALIVAVALTEGEDMALWALLVCLAVQQAEAYVVQPLVQRWAVRLPPVLGLLAVLLFGLLFGLPGVLLAVPLMVLTMTLVKQLYVQTLLEPAGPPVEPKAMAPKAVVPPAEHRQTRR